MQSLQHDSELPHDAMVRVQGDVVANDYGVSKILKSSRGVFEVSMTCWTYQHPVPARSRRSAHMSRRRIIVSCILPCASQPSMPAAASRLTLVVRSRYDVRVVPKALLAFCVMCFLMRPNQRQRTLGGSGAHHSDYYTNRRRRGLTILRKPGRRVSDARRYIRV